MVTPEQMVAIAAPMIVREMEAMLADELEACSPWSVADDLVTDDVAVTLAMISQCRWMSW